MRALLAVLIVGGAACEPLPPQSMDEIEFAPGVRLDTNREVAFEVDDPLDATILVRLQDGRTVYGGPASLPARRPVRLRVPAGTAGFWVDIRIAHQPEDRVWVEMVDDLAVLRMGGAT